MTAGFSCVSREAGNVARWPRRGVKKVLAEASRIPRSLNYAAAASGHNGNAVGEGHAEIVFPDAEAQSPQPSSPVARAGLHAVHGTGSPTVSPRFSPPHWHKKDASMSPLNALRTPGNAFTHLPGYSFTSHALIDLPHSVGLRLRYVDEGPRDARQTFLCLHGQPTWSYLFRKMIPVFTEAGHRAVAPDLYGFGQSDKPTDDAAYTFEFHRQTLLDVVERLDLRRITLVCQDWGGLLGLTLPMDLPDRFDRLIVMNTALGTGDVPLGRGFLAWRAYAESHPDLDVAALLKRSSPGLKDEEAAAYAAPYPDATYKAGVRAFPRLVPDRPDAPGAELSRRARTWWQEEWRGQSFMAVGMQDPVLGPPVMRLLRSQIRGCPLPLEIAQGGHFVQEDAGEQVARAALAAFANPDE